MVRHATASWGLIAAIALGAGALIAEAGTIPPAVRGDTVVLMYVEPGELSLRLFKRDLNIYDGAEDIAGRVFDPQRRLVATLLIPDDGNAGKGGTSKRLQSTATTIKCETPGVYQLHVNGRGGSQDYVFGLRTSCDSYLVQSDSVLLNDGHLAGKVYFAAPDGSFEITAQALHIPGKQTMAVLDAAGDTVQTFDLVTAGQDLIYTVPADVGARDGLWAFDIAKMDVKIQVKGVSYWTTEPDAWFDQSRTKWMLMPRRTVRYLTPGEFAQVPCTLLNTTGSEDAFELEAVGADGLECELVEPAPPVKLKANGSQAAMVRVTIPDDAGIDTVLQGYLLARAQTDASLASRMSIEVRVGQAPVSNTIETPIVLRRYEHENVQFGYAPEYETNEVYFDRQNRAFIRDRNEGLYHTSAITFLDEGDWVRRPFVPAIEEAYGSYHGAYGGGGFVGAKIAFDKENDIYTLLQAIVPGDDGNKRTQSLLVYSADEGATYQLYELPPGSFDIEQFTGHNTLDSPPPILVYRKTADHAGRWANVNDLLLFVPQKRDGKIELGEPIVISDLCIGACQHSGGPGTLATRDGKTHIVWGEVTDPSKPAPGVPTYCATYDHATGTLSEKALIGYAPPINDVHNVPAICLDSEGYIHVLTGAHGAPFTYSRSLKPNDSTAGWTEPVDVLSAGFVTADSDADGLGRQTYISLVCDQEDTLHIAYRQWRNSEPYHDGGTYAALSVQSMPKGGNWGPARPIVIPPTAGYSIYYHKLTTDRIGRLYLSYNHWTSDLTYQSDFPGRYHHRAVLVSKDNGVSWKLAETRDFTEATQTF